MRGIIWAVLAGAATMSAATLIPARAAAQPALQWKCTGDADLASDVQIDGCTAAIRSGKYSGRNLAWAYVNRGNAYRHKGDNDHAFADYDEAIRLNPKEANAFMNRGLVYYDKDDYDRAIHDYGEALQINPEDPVALNDRCDEFALLRQFIAARLDCDTSLKIRPNHVNTLQHRGEVLLALEKFDDAVADYDNGCGKIRKMPTRSMYGEQQS
jgi:tetratricopeptide (TPR) repeat protein